MLIVIDGEEPAALLVDSVSEVVQLDSAFFDPLPATKKQARTPSILRELARRDDGIIIVLDMPSLIQHEFSAEQIGGAKT